MPKRFTETTKWTDRWYRTLPIKHKIFWQYLCDRCDNAGVWNIDFELASFYIGDTVNEKDIEVLNNGKERVVIVNAKYLIIKEFIAFQIGDTKQEKLTNLQKNCNSLVDLYLQKGVDIVKITNLTSKLRVTNRKPTDIGKDKGKDKDKDIGKGKDIIDIINDLNLVLGTSYKPNSSKTKEIITARFNEGFTIDDFKAVHRKMFSCWGADEKMCKYLRPITLYSNKFESYLNMPLAVIQTKVSPKTLKSGMALNSWMNKEGNK